MKLRAIALGSMGMVAMSAACFLKPEPDYSSDIGVDGVPLEDGQLAGVWASQLEFATIIKLPVIGDRNAGSNGGRLMTLTWDAGAGVYNISMKWCWDDIFEVEGTKNIIPDANLDRLGPVQGTVNVEHDRGSWRAGRLIDLWCVQNLDDPYGSPLPNEDNYQQSPQSEQVYDEDGDGKLACTSVVTGGTNGEAYFVNRGIYTLRGVAKATDEIVGLLEQEDVVQIVLESTINLPGNVSTGRSDLRPDPDPKASWFQAVRLQDGATCADVLAARDSGRLSARRPF